MKKRIAIITKKLITGGVERALIAMLGQLDDRQYDVDVYVETLGGELSHELPSHTTLRQLPVFTTREIIKHPLLFLVKLWSRTLISIRKFPYIKQCFYSSQMRPPLKKQYDIAIAYHAPNTVSVFYTIDKITAKKKILWLHGDLCTNQGGTALAKKYHATYDRVVAVSLAVQKSFWLYHPNQRCELFYNLIHLDKLKKLAREGTTYSDNFRGFRILSVGRLDKQKGFDIALEACVLLAKENIEFRWYICGEGDERASLESQIEQAGMSKHFILLGNQPNPYRFMADCNLYVQPSRSEGYCTTTNEARYLGKAVITTDVSGAREQFEDGKNGWIVPISAPCLAKKIISLIKNPQSIKKIEQNLSSLPKTGQTNPNDFLAQ